MNNDTNGANCHGSFGTIGAEMFINTYYVNSSKPNQTFNKRDAILVVEKLNLFDVEAFFFVEILLIFENSLIEKLLQFLVAVVDAKLLEAVGLEVFESGDV